jgi:competence protein ComEC
VLRLVYGRARVLFTGDAGGAAESDLLRALPPSALRADVLKAGHHGSRFSTSDEFLAAVRPSAAVLSAGRNNLYGHPSPQVLDRLARRGVHTFRTDRQGAITVETDGERIRVTPYGAR